jgi:hypothetical protein
VSLSHTLSLLRAYSHISGKSIKITTLQNNGTSPTQPVPGWVFDTDTATWKVGEMVQESVDTEDASAEQFDTFFARGLEIVYGAQVPKRMCTLQQHNTPNVCLA